MKPWISLVLAGLTLASLSFARCAHADTSLDARRSSLKGLLAEQWEFTLRTNPEQATNYGDNRWNDKLTDFSSEGIEMRLAKAREFLSRFEALDATGFTDQEALNRALMIRDLKAWEIPVSQMSGVHLRYAQFVSLLPFKTARDYENYVARLKALPAAFDQVTVQMRKGMAEGLMPPRFLLEKVAVQCHTIDSKAAAETPFAEPFSRFPDAVAPKDRDRLRASGMAAIESGVLPAYRKFEVFVRTEYAPRGRTELGIWALPEGDARYAAAVRATTTTDLSPEEIHQLGLKQVAQLEVEELEIAKKLGFADVRSLRAAATKDPKLHPASREDMLDRYRAFTAGMWKKLPGLFGRLPKAQLEVRAVEQFREKEAAEAQYQGGTPDGSRPGHVEVNTGDFADRSTVQIEATSYHEGVPGHHMQIALAQELETLPPFRQHAHYTAFVEGWALYAERLGKELGFYQDPYSDYGRLESELLRGVRLVVDSGFHYKHWSRQQVVDYFHEHTATDEPAVQAETDRYISWPAQALSYKVGQLKILELRERARTALGEHFELRGFHDEVLSGGALPLDVLSTRIDSWIAAQKGQQAGSGSAPAGGGGSR